MTQDPSKVIESEVESALALQKELADTENKLMQNEEFRSFLELQKTVNAKVAEVWKKVEQQMLDNNVKAVKGDWGSLTIVEKDYFKVPDIDELPRKFIVKSPNDKMIRAAFKLEGKLPKGVEKTTTKYLMKKLK